MTNLKRFLTLTSMTALLLVGCAKAEDENQEVNNDLPEIETPADVEVKEEVKQSDFNEVPIEITVATNKDFAVNYFEDAMLSKRDDISVESLYNNKLATDYIGDYQETFLNLMIDMNNELSKSLNENPIDIGDKSILNQSTLYTEEPTHLYELQIEQRVSTNYYAQSETTILIVDKNLDEFVTTTAEPQLGTAKFSIVDDLQTHNEQFEKAIDVSELDVIVPTIYEDDNYIISIVPTVDSYLMSEDPIGTLNNLVNRFQEASIQDIFMDYLSK